MPKPVGSEEDHLSYCNNFIGEKTKTKCHLVVIYIYIYIYIYISLFWVSFANNDYYFGLRYSFIVNKYINNNIDLLAKSGFVNIYTFRYVISFPLPSPPKNHLIYVIKYTKSQHTSNPRLALCRVVVSSWNFRIVS